MSTNIEYFIRKFHSDSLWIGIIQFFYYFNVLNRLNWFIVYISIASACDTHISQKLSGPLRLLKFFSPQRQSFLVGTVSSMLEMACCAWRETVWWAESGGNLAALNSSTENASQHHEVQKGHEHFLSNKLKWKHAGSKVFQCFLLIKNKQII